MRDLFVARLAAIVALAGASSTAAKGQGMESRSESVNPYQKTYLMLEFARNYPISFAQNRFVPGPYSPALGYRHNLDEHWIMGVGGQFKILKRRDTEDLSDDESDVLALWTLTHETLYSIRLDHPTYLLIGPKFHYLLPANASKLPLQRSDDYQTEIGAALSMVIAHLVDDRFMLTARIDRWRGTRTMRFHGIEVAAGLGVALK